MYNVNDMVQTEEQYVAHMDTKQDSGLLLVSNLFENKSSQKVYFTYKFKCVRLSPSGISANSQSGNLMAAPGQVINLSKTSLSIRPSDSYNLLLEIYDGNKLVANQALMVPHL